MTEYPTIPELDETQARDWVHRKGVDPPESWESLWLMPVVEGSAGAADSGPCMCGRAACGAPAPSGNCGIYVHDHVTCWRCKGIVPCAVCCGL